MQSSHGTLVGVRDPHDTSRLAAMAPRAVRRKLQRKKFRPVYHHGLAISPSHSSVISAMYVKDRRQARVWQARVDIARACRDWGVAVQDAAKRMALSQMKLRHEALKTAGKWIERNVKFGYE